MVVVKRMCSGWVVESVCVVGGMPMCECGGRGREAEKTIAHIHTCIESSF